MFHPPDLAAFASRADVYLMILSHYDTLFIRLSEKMERSLVDESNLWELDLCHVFLFELAGIVSKRLF